MLGNLFSKASRSLAGSVYDHLFDEDDRVKPEQGGPYPVGLVLFLIWSTSSLSKAKQKHYEDLVKHILGNQTWPKSRDEVIELFYQKQKPLQAAYICCFEPFQLFQHELNICHDPDLRDRLIDTRTRLVAELIPENAARVAHRVRHSRFVECRAAPLDIIGETPLDLIKQMSSDDWHEIAGTWNWDMGAAELGWITSQPECDRSTAIDVMCLGNLCDVANYMTQYPSREGQVWDMVHDIAERIGAGFYRKAELVGLCFDVRQIEVARATGRKPWLMPDDILVQKNARKHQPKYTMNDARVAWAYDYWLANIAPPLPIK